MKVKLIATDVDGTLVGDDHLTIADVNIEGLRKASDKGTKIAIATGRTYDLTEPEMNQVGCVDYLVLSNGAIVVNAENKEVIYNCYLEAEQAEKIIEIFAKYPMTYEVYADGKAYISQYTFDNYGDIKTLPKVFLKQYIKRLTVVDSIHEAVATGKVEKFNVNYVEEQYVPDIMEQLKDIPGLEYSAGFVGNIEITAAGADKGRALSWLADELGMTAGDVMTFGDSANDATMLEWAEKSYAMKNGNATAKGAATYVTEKDNNEGGVGATVLDYIENDNL